MSDEDQIKRMREQQARNRRSKDLATRRAAKAREEATKRDRERQQREKKARQDREALAAFDKARGHNQRGGNPSKRACLPIAVAGMGGLAAAAYGLLEAAQRVW